MHQCGATGNAIHQHAGHPGTRRERTTVVRRALAARLFVAHRDAAERERAGDGSTDHAGAHPRPHADPFADSETNQEADAHSVPDSHTHAG